MNKLHNVIEVNKVRCLGLLGEVFTLNWVVTTVVTKVMRFGQSLERSKGVTHRYIWQKEQAVLVSLQNKMSKVVRKASITGVKGERGSLVVSPCPY